MMCIWSLHLLASGGASKPRNLSVARKVERRLKERKKELQKRKQLFYVNCQQFGVFLLLTD